MNIEGLAIHCLANELNNALSGGRILRITQPTRYLFLLRIRLTQQEISLAMLKKLTAEDFSQDENRPMCLQRCIGFSGTA